MGASSSARGISGVCGGQGDVAASEVTPAAPTPENQPGGISAAPALCSPASTGDDDSRAAGRPRYPVELGGSPSLLLPCSPRAASPAILQLWGRLAACFGPRGLWVWIRTVGLGVKRGGGRLQGGGVEPHTEGVWDKGTQGISSLAERVLALSLQQPKYTLTHQPREGALRGWSQSPAVASAGGSCRLEGRT